MVSFWRDPAGFLLSLAREHGDVARFRWGRTDEYLLNHPDFVQRVLVTDQRSFMKGQALQETKRILGEGLLTSEGELHMRQRRLMQPLFHRRHVEGYGEAMVSSAERVAASWRGRERIDAQREMARLTLSIVGRTLFAADVDGEAAEIGVALTHALDSIKLLTLPMSGAIAALPIPAMRRLQRSRARLDATIYRLIRERKANGHGADDLLSLLVGAGHETGEPMSDEQIRDEAMTLFLAGHETTAAALTWTWFLLAQHPDVETRLHDELDAVLGDRSPRVADLPRLSYTEMVVSEAIRLYPPAWLIGRRALVDFDAGPYVLPARSIVILSPYVSHRDPRWFPEPERFDPERWTEEGKASRPKWSYFPFGGGARTCIGEAFARMETKLVLATLARRWRLRAIIGHEAKLHPRVTLRPRGGMPMTLERRAPALESTVGAGRGLREQHRARLD
jgi:cytochrome P450